MYYTYSWRDRGVLFKFFGENINAVQVVDVLNLFHENPSTNHGDFQIMDFSNTKKIMMDKDDIQELAYLHNAVSLSLRNIKVAIICRSREACQLMAIYTNISKKINLSWDFKIFCDLSDAEKWVLDKGNKMLSSVNTNKCLSAYC